MNLKDPIDKLPLVGPTFAKKLQKLNIETIEDLLNHYPFRYDDFSIISPIAQIQPGETVTIRGKIEKIANEYTKNRKQIQKATVSDQYGQIELVWFNQPFLTKTIKVGQIYNFSGKVEWFGRNKTIISPEYEIYKNDSIHTGRLVPVYPETYGISTKWLRSRIKTALETLGEQIKEFLPSETVAKEGIISENQAIKQIHFPQNKQLAESSRYRLAFDELFLIQLSALIRKQEWEKKATGKSFMASAEKMQAFLEKLPFELTGAQKRCINEILSDLQKTTPMNRLLEGDVGSGKTVVAAAAAYLACLNGYQTLLMAPTEILANQHFKTFQSLLEPLGIKITLITSSTRKATFDEDVQIIVGTHSLLYQDFKQDKIGLVIVDEQHRFGVEQRTLLSQKGLSPHFLTMTATPIPRSIALTLYGDLDLSVIDELPKGRIKIKTWVVPKTKRKDAYKWIGSKLKENGEQAFIVCPLIEESESLSSVKAATKEFETLSKDVFPNLKLGLLHGRIKSKEKDQILNDFKEGKLDILVSTPVVEVGIDIPNATIMVIEAADRFGLAQLHQLRGRVGRSSLESFCFLFTENETPEIIQRLKTMEMTNIGMELAEIDLKLRGPGEVYGTRQHGFTNLRVASLTDLALIQKTRKAAEEVLRSGQISFDLQTRLQKYKIDSVQN
ncbi:MAG: ATP-dependent DNA helicase RecG [Patescibacteria group bacterium]|jgi:ATP-dependent DNA helicase RecG